ncbi:mitochondrial uncoupling protein 4 [Exaiptasia diaphana]|uniref:Mitochondrial uncoupling protein 4 n=1 Tax=Exaiptasia diaphana TaxID=2652724 RepID=A0A913X155_EXADI|nr:mitochondrial uncoupling protein 4 [Exaiptasia diaphana]KXJ16192.1 Mitochondrial uncoupling protein 4 [Exaiptasia diaphana]
MASNSKQNGFLRKYILSSAAATFAETVTFPLDITKTRLQIQGERASMVSSNGHTVAYRGMVQTAIGIVREEGLLRLWNGITPAVMRHIVYTGSRMTVYEFLRNKVLKRNTDGLFPIWKSVISGMTAGAVGQFISSPTDLVKVQMQMEGRRVLVEKRKPRVRSTLHAFRNIIKHHGLKGLWKGWFPNVQRAALVNMGDLTTYDTVKHNILKHTNMKDDWVLHTVSSVCSGFVASIISTPADVVKTRIMNNPSEYRGSIDCFKRAVKQEGFFSLYKGWLPTWSRMAPWSLTFWLTYEQIRKLSGASGF